MMLAAAADVSGAGILDEGERAAIGDSRAAELLDYLLHSNPRWRPQVGDVATRLQSVLRDLQ